MRAVCVSTDVPSALWMLVGSMQGTWWACCLKTPHTLFCALAPFPTTFHVHIIRGSDDSAMQISFGNRFETISAEEEQALDLHLTTLGAYRKPIVKDGSCLFRAVAEQVSVRVRVRVSACVCLCAGWRRLLGWMRGCLFCLFLHFFTTPWGVYWKGI